MSVLQFTPSACRARQRQHRLFDLDPRALRHSATTLPRRRCGHYMVFAFDAATREHLSIRVWADDIQQARNLAKCRLIEQGRRADALEIGVAVPKTEEREPAAPLATSVLLMLYWRLMWFGF